MTKSRELTGLYCARGKCQQTTKCKTGGSSEEDNLQIGTAAAVLVPEEAVGLAAPDRTKQVAQGQNILQLRLQALQPELLGVWMLNP